MSSFKNSSYENGSYETDSFLPREIEVGSMYLIIQEVYFRKIIPIFNGIGAIGNILIIVYFLKINWKKLKKMSSYHYLLIHLAVADFIVCTGGIPSNMTMYNLGEFGCRYLMLLFAGVSGGASCYLLVIISFARYRAIV